MDFSGESRPIRQTGRTDFTPGSIGLTYLFAFTVISNVGR